ncbi:MAG: hypothetical protein RJA90_1292 [Bacteroidota bacterium]
MLKCYFKGCLRISLLLGLTLYVLPLFAQGLPVPLDNPGIEWIERLQIKSGVRLSSHTALKNYQRKAIWDF